MNKEYSIYITSPESIASSEWMNVFVNNLQMALSRTSSANLNFKLKDKDSETWLEKIENTNVFIALLDGSDDEKYLNELYAISDSIQKLSQASKDVHLYKIYLSPYKGIKQPAIFNTVEGYQFFELSGRMGKVLKLDFDNKEQKTKAWNLLLDLSFDFREKCSAGRTQEDKEIDDPEKYIYLTRCTSKLYSVRDEIKRELQQLGYSILPESDTEDLFEQGDETIKESLNKSSFIVQIMGEKYGEIIKGDRISLHEKESTAISNYIDDIIELRRLIWIPDFLKRKEQKQELFINRIKQKESNSNTEVIETSLNEFKDILLQRLNKEQNKSPQTSISGEAYLITPHDTDLNELNLIAQSLKINLKTINNSDQATLYHKHIDLLTNSDNIIIHWVNTDLTWLKSKLSDLIKAPGLGKTNAYNSIGILVNGTTPDLTNYSNWLPNIHVIQHDDIDELKNYFQRIIE